MGTFGPCKYDLLKKESSNLLAQYVHQVIRGNYELHSTCNTPFFAQSCLLSLTNGRYTCCWLPRVSWTCKINGRIRTVTDAPSPFSSQSFPVITNSSDVKILLKFVRPRLTGIAGRQLNVCGAFLHQVPSRSFSSYYSFSFVCQK